MRNAKRNKKWILAAAVSLYVLMPLNSFAQEETESTPPKEVQKPVRSPYSASTLIETQSYMVFPQKTMVFVIQHRFGKLNSNTFDLLGLYAPSNIRMGISYGAFKNFQVGIGSTKNNKLQDLNWKYKILTQTRSNSMPIALAYFGNVEYDLRDEENFGTEYKGSNRISYFNQLILGRKFSTKLTIQLMANYAHFNQIDTTSLPELEHSNFGVGIAGRFKFSPQTSILFEYEHPMTTPEEIKPNISFGLEIATSSHAFQLFITTYDGISYSRNLMYNTNDFNEQDILIGFNITRNWSF